MPATEDGRRPQLTACASPVRTSGGGGPRAARYRTLAFLGRPLRPRARLCRRNDNAHSHRPARPAFYRTSVRGSSVRGACVRPSPTPSVARRPLQDAPRGPSQVRASGALTNVSDRAVARDALQMARDALQMQACARARMKPAITPPHTGSYRAPHLPGQSHSLSDCSDSAASRRAPARSNAR